MGIVGDVDAGDPAPRVGGAIVAVEPVDLRAGVADQQVLETVAVDINNLGRE